MIKKLLLPVMLTIFSVNIIFSQNTAIPACTVNSAADVGNWAIFPTTVSKQWFNGNCIAMFVDNLSGNQPAYITSPIFNIPNSGNYELEIRYGLVYSSVAAVFELVTSPAAATISTSATSTIVGTCINWPNPKITKLNYSGLPAGNYRLRVTIPMNSQFFIEGLKSNINYSTADVADNQTNMIFKIHPNPNNGSFFVQLTNNSSEINALKIFSLQGKLLFDQKFTSSNQEIKTTKLNTGVYLLKIEFENGVTSHQKIIIQ